MNIVLGSKSSRRKELLELMGYNFIVDGIDIDEIVTNYKNSVDYVRKVAERKGKIVAKKYPESLVICADTIVVVDDKILNKPASIDEARNMIKLIENKSHFVLTGVYLRYKNKIKTFVEKTKVEIDKIEDIDIERYVNTTEPYDKAGGYAIQGIFAKHIKGIKGDYYNVMGLPINKLYREIKKLEKV